jgi:hypothetical protein
MPEKSSNRAGEIAKLNGLTLSDPQSTEALIEAVQDILRPVLDHDFGEAMPAHVFKVIGQYAQ